MWWVGEDTYRRGKSTEFIPAFIICNWMAALHANRTVPCHITPREWLFVTKYFNAFASLHCFKKRKKKSPATGKSCRSYRSEVPCDALIRSKHNGRGPHWCRGQLPSSCVRDCSFSARSCRACSKASAPICFTRQNACV